MGFLVKRGVIFGTVIGKIFRYRSPKETRLALRFAAAELVVFQVHGFGLALNDGVISNTHGSRVIALDGRFMLRPTHFDEGIPKRDHGFGTDE